MTIDAERIARDRALAEAASPAPWAVEEGTDVDGTPFRHIEGWCDEGKSWMCLDAADARFIAAARTLLPEYITEVERLQAENARLRAALTRGLFVLNHRVANDRWMGVSAIQRLTELINETLAGGQP